jgi:hypothetical protein
MCWQGRSGDRVPTSKRLCGLLCRFRHFVQEKNLLPLVGIQHQILGCPACSFVIVVISQDAMMVMMIIII